MNKYCASCKKMSKVKIEERSDNTKQNTRRVVFENIRNTVISSNLLPYASLNKRTCPRLPWSAVVLPQSASPIRRLGFPEPPAHPSLPPPTPPKSRTRRPPPLPRLRTKSPNTAKSRRNRPRTWTRFEASTLRPRAHCRSSAVPL
jgi:hypothetical protein